MIEDIHKIFGIRHYQLSDVAFAELLWPLLLIVVVVVRGQSASERVSVTDVLRWTPCSTLYWRCRRTDSSEASYDRRFPHTLDLQQTSSQHNLCNIPRPAATPNQHRLTNMPTKYDFYRTKTKQAERSNTFFVTLNVKLIDASIVFMLAAKQRTPAIKLAILTTTIFEAQVI